jgi:hypothetical protein
MTAMLNAQGTSTMQGTYGAQGSYAAAAAHLTTDGPGHAVARPVVDGLDQSLCGVLVSVRADQDWGSVTSGGRCEECARIAG